MPGSSNCAKCLLNFIYKTSQKAYMLHGWKIQVCLVSCLPGVDPSLNKNLPKTKLDAAKLGKKNSFPLGEIKSGFYRTN